VRSAVGSRRLRGGQNEWMTETRIHFRSNVRVIHRARSREYISTLCMFAVRGIGPCEPIRESPTVFAGCITTGPTVEMVKSVSTISTELADREAIVEDLRIVHSSTAPAVDFESLVFGLVPRCRS
jgi:hypothetical protein